MTFATKFVMGYVAGVVFNKTKKSVLAGTIGEIAYIILYALKTYIERRFILSMAIEAVIPILMAKIGASVVNALAAIIVSTILYNVLKKVKIS